MPAGKGLSLITFSVNIKSSLTAGAHVVLPEVSSRISIKMEVPEMCKQSTFLSFCRKQYAKQIAQPRKLGGDSQSPISMAVSEANKQQRTDLFLESSQEQATPCFSLFS